MLSKKSRAGHSNKKRLENADSSQKFIQGWGILISLQCDTGRCELPLENGTFRLLSGADFEPLTVKGTFLLSVSSCDICSLNHLNLNSKTSTSYSDVQV